MKAPRLASLDAFRGFAIAGMVLVNNPGSWTSVHPPLAHAAWNGCTFTDLIFPFFLFAAGLSLAISLGNRARAGRWAAYRTLLRRAATLALIGILMGAIPAFAWSTLRIPGVLQRIGLTLALGAPVVLWGGWRGALAAIGALVALWLGLQFLVPVPGADGVVAAGRLLPGCDFGSWLDRALLGGHLWARARTWDPEGLVGTLTATASLLFGVLAAHLLARPAAGRPRGPVLVLLGLGLLAAGLLWGRVLPLNKSLWTPSYTLATAGWSFLLLGAFQGLLDEAPEGLRDRARRICQPLSIYGLNALFMFVLSGLVARFIQTVKVDGPAGAVPLKQAMFEALARLPLAPANASLLFAVLFDLALFAVAWGLWRKRWVIKV